MNELISIESGETKATISKVGGTIVSFSVDGEDVLYPRQMVGEKTRGGCPICAPWFGSSPRGPKRHGFLRDLEASECLIRGTNAVELTFDHPGNEGYLWHLLFSTSITVGNGELSMLFRMRRGPDDNRDPAPVLPAFHPYFPCKDVSGVRVLMGKDEHRGFSEKARAVPLSNRVVLIETSEAGKKIKMELFSVDEVRLVLWTDAPDKYVCVEPVFGKRELFDTREGRFLWSRMEVAAYMSLTMV